VKTQDLEYRDEAGGRYVGYLASPEHPTGPAILIGHGAPGIDAHERDVAQRLAELGYVALAADYLGAENTVSQEAKGARLQALFADSTGLRAPMQTALAALKAIAGVAADRVAVIGYCFGGTAALELGCTGADFKALIGLHCALPLSHPADYRNIKCPVLLLQGARDPIVPPEMRTAFAAQMNETEVDWREVLYGQALHGFTMRNAEKFGRPDVVYHQRTDERSWRAMLDLFAETIGAP